VSFSLWNACVPKGASKGDVNINQTSFSLFLHHPHNDLLLPASLNQPASNLHQSECLILNCCTLFLLLAIKMEGLPLYRQTFICVMATYPLLLKVNVTTQISPSLLNTLK
jgi:hypothetical protein